MPDFLPVRSTAVIRIIGLSTLFIQSGTGENSKTEKNDDKPNIILCMADDQGWGDMGYNGHPVLKTPNFDSMAKSGLCFDRFYAAAPVCSPTRGSVMTGRHPNRFGCFSWGNTIRPQEITIAEALKTAGYVTGHFGKWHLGPVRSNSPINPGNSGFDEWFSSPNFFDNNPILSREGKAVQTMGESSMVTVDAAIDFIRNQTNNRNPFFAVVWFGSPHNPHIAIDQDRDLYKDQEERLQQYYGEITGMDRAFGKLRQELKILGINKKTILWFCSDNGGQHDSYSHTGGRGFKGQIYEGGLRVPAILEWPERMSVHRSTNIPTNTSDIYPTLLELAGVKIKNQPPVDGISLVPLIDNKMNRRKKPMGFWQYPARGRIVSSEKLMADLLREKETGTSDSDTSLLDLQAGVISAKYREDVFPGHSAWLDWPYKLHRINSENDDIRFELYSLDEDPGEQNDLSAVKPELVKIMTTQMEAWQKSVIHSLNGDDYK
jgi:arylsulfatase A-like enzyme